jgi:predicted dinucleotide-binding enzyme
MKIAVIGSGPRAAGIASLLTGGGYEVTLADESAGDVPYEVVTGSEVIVFASPREQVDDLVLKVGRILPETIVIDATEGETAEGESGAESMARKLDSHRVVRASIHRPEPNSNILLAADDPDVMTVVEEIFRKCGCVTTDRGTLVNAAEIEARPAGVTG